MELKIINNKGIESGSIQFDEALVSTKASPSVLHEVIVGYSAGLRLGTHAVKTRATVSGGGIKPWRQKGTGNARAGSTRSPLWRKGGIIFGPVPRDYSVQIPKKKKQIAFKLAVKGLMNDNRIQVVEPIAISEPKTKLVAAVYAKWNAPTDSIYLVSKIDPKLGRAAKNVANVRLSEVASFNAYDCLRARKVFITADALKDLAARLTAKSEN